MMYIRFMPMLMLMLLVLLVARLSSRIMAADWAQWRGPQRNGASASGPALANAWPTSGLMPLWSNTHFSFGSNIEGYGSPVVAGDNLYLVYKTSLISVDARNGALRWKTTPLQPDQGSASSTPCVANGKVYVLLNGAPTCLDAQTGALLWSKEVIRSGINSSPLVVNGLAIFCAPALLLAYNGVTGKQVWSQPKACTLSGENGSPASWVHAKKTYIITNTEQGQVCTDADTGEVKWSLSPGGSWQTPAIVGDIELVGVGKSLCAFHLDEAKPVKLWEVPMKQRTDSSPTVAGDDVITFGNGNLTCVNWRTGKVAWEQPADNVYSSPVYADGKFFACVDGTANTLVMVQVADAGYHELARMTIAGACCTSPAIADGKLYLRLHSGIGCYDLRAGTTKIMQPGGIRQ